MNGEKSTRKITSMRSLCCVVMVVAGLAGAWAMTGCGKSEGSSEALPVSCTEDQMKIWNDFVKKTKENNWKPVLLYTRKQQPVRNLNELTNKDEFAICSLYRDYSSLMLGLLGHDEDDLVGLRVCGGKPETLDDPKLRLYLAFEEWEEELNSYGWVRVNLVGR